MYSEHKETYKTELSEKKPINNNNNNNNSIPLHFHKKNSIADVNPGS